MSAAPTVEPTAPPLPSIDFPATSACVLQTARWRAVTNHPTPLTLAPDGAAFAKVSGGRARLSFSEGPRPAAQLLETSDGGLTLRGFVAPGEVDLRAARSFALNGFVFPTIFTPLAWVEGKAAALVITIAVPAGLEPVAPLRATRDCGDVSIAGPGPFNPSEEIAAGRTPTYMELPKGAAVTLFSEPGKEPLAVLRAAADNAGVTVLSRKGKHTEILWSPDTVVVHGWVETKTLSSAKAGVGFGTGHGGFGENVPHDEVKVVRCPADVAVIAAVGAERVRVGEIAAGTRIEVLAATDDTRVGVRVRKSMLRPASGTAFFVSSNEIAACRESDSP